MSTHNTGFYEDLTKIIFELSSNTHLISSADRLRYKAIFTLPYYFLYTHLIKFSFKNIKFYQQWCVLYGSIDIL